MEWESPWGVGFPGWHIECSAMSMAVIGSAQLDIHTGGTDLIPVHHTNEIAQSEAATGKVPFVHYWVHGQFMMVDGIKMAKSKKNFYRLSDIEAKGYEPLALRYLYMTAHYRTYMNFTWEGLRAAQNSLNELRDVVSKLPRSLKLPSVPNSFQKKFSSSLENDLNMPQALAVVWEVVKSSIPPEEKYALLMDFDKVLGLDLQDVPRVTSHVSHIPDDIIQLTNKREEFRKNKKFDEADIVRKQIEAKGYTVEDTSSGFVVSKIH